MLARVLGRATAGARGSAGIALPWRWSAGDLCQSVLRAREQSNLLKLAGAGVLLSAALSDEPAECGKRGPQKAAKNAPAPPAPKPKGKGPIKRTPTSAFDPAAKDDDIHQCEKTVAERLAKGVQGVALVCGQRPTVRHVALEIAL